MTDLSGKIALVTGASRGIGAAVAKAYAKAGAHVVLLGRTVGGLEETDDAIRLSGGKATIMPADLSDLDKLDALGPTLLNHFGGLDIVVGNAGYLATNGPLAHAGVKEWDISMTVNVAANFRLIRTLDPLLQRSNAGRAIFVTSGVTSNARAYWGAYAVSKAALEMLAKTYAAENENTNVRVNVIDPGRVRTAMRAKAYPGEDPLSRPAPEDITQPFLDLASDACTKNGEIVFIG